MLLGRIISTNKQKSHVQSNQWLMKFVLVIIRLGQDLGAQCQGNVTGTLASGSISQHNKVTMSAHCLLQVGTSPGMI